MMNWHRARKGSFAVVVLALAVPGVALADPPAPPAAANPASTAKPWAAPADRDKDGVPDNVDACPDVPGVKTNEPKTTGCPNNPWGAPAGASDRDKDGVPDSIDACPDQAIRRA